MSFRRLSGTLRNWAIVVLEVPGGVATVRGSPDRWLRPTLHLCGVCKGEKIRTSPIVRVGVTGDRCVVETFSGSLYVVRGVPCAEYISCVGRYLGIRDATAVTNEWWCWNAETIAGHISEVSRACL
tara:strand:- start:137 stop:514 length:378 start_codon:yes stop_codon:yes gene_type:complete